MANRVIHFEIPAQDPQKAKTFYENTFEWKIVKFEGPVAYYLIETGDSNEIGINGAIYEKSNNLSEVINTIGVSNLEKFIEKVKGNGGSVDGEIMDIPGVGKFVHATDPEGVRFGMLETYAQENLA